MVFWFRFLPVTITTSPFNNPLSCEFVKCPLICASLSAMIGVEKKRQWGYGKKMPCG
jgi:Na+/H+ antiporter NhaB